MTDHSDPFSNADLQKALQRRDPPDGFAGRTLARISAEPGAAVSPARAESNFRRWIGWGAMAAAASIALVVGGAEYRGRQKEADARRAAQQLTVALRITSDTLREVQNRLERK